MGLKRFIGALLCTAIIFTSGATYIYADNNAQTQIKRMGETAEYALEILNAIGVLTEYNAESLNPDQPITRGDFSDVLARMMKLETNSDALYYHDVSREHYAYKTITALTEAGYVNGTGSGMFEPDEEIGVSEAMKMLVIALGYKPEAVALGNDLSAYLTIASRLKLAKGCSNSPIVTAEDMVIMLKNTCLAPMYIFNMSGRPVAYNDDNTTYILKTYYGYSYCSKGRVTEANGTSLSGVYGDSKHIKIDEERFIPPKADMSEYLGRYVDYIYSGELGEDECRIIWIRKNKANEEIVIDDYDKIAGFEKESYRFKYYGDGGKLKYIPISKGASVFYNGKFMENIEEALSRSCSYAGFVRNSNGEYDVCCLYNCEDIVIEYINSNDLTIIGRDKTEAVSIDSANYDSFIIKDSDGGEAETGILAVDTAASIYMSDDKRYITIVVSKDKAEGVAETVKKNSDGRICVTIDGNTYTECSAGVLKDVKAGDTVRLYLDARKMIVYGKRISDEYFCAYIIRALNTYNDRVRIKAFTQNNKIEILETADRFSADEVPFREDQSEQRALDELCDNLAGKISLIKFNPDGEIREIDTAEGDGILKISDPLGEKAYRNVSVKLGKLSALDDDTKIFSTPISDTDDDEKNYRLMKKSELYTWKTYNAEAYQLSDSDSATADIVLIKGYNWDEISTDRTPFVFDEISEGINDEGDIVKILSGYDGSTKKEYFCTTDCVLPNLNVGDVVDLGINREQKVVRISVVCTAETLPTEGTEGMFSEGRWTLGYANDIKGNIVKVGYDDMSVADEIFDCLASTVIVCDPNKREKLYIGSASDIQTYKNSGADCSRVFVRTYQMEQRLMVVYNN